MQSRGAAGGGQGGDQGGDQDQKPSWNARLRARGAAQEVKLFEKLNCIRPRRTR